MAQECRGGGGHWRRRGATRGGFSPTIQPVMLAFQASGKPKQSELKPRWYRPLGQSFSTHTLTTETRSTTVSLKHQILTRKQPFSSALILVQTPTPIIMPSSFTDEVGHLHIVYAPIELSQLTREVLERANKTLAEPFLIQILHPTRQSCQPRSIKSGNKLLLYSAT